MTAGQNCPAVILSLAQATMTEGYFSERQPGRAAISAVTQVWKRLEEKNRLLALYFVVYGLTGCRCGLDKFSKFQVFGVFGIGL